MEVSLSVSFDFGSIVQFSYPRHNYRHVLHSPMELRRVIVHRVVDFREVEPDGSYPMEPELRRGKLMIVGYDLDRKGVRRFYVESMSELRMLDTEAKPLPPLKAAIVKGAMFDRFTEMPDPRERYCQTFGDFAIGAVAVPA
jgi:hypothetical protein